MPPALLTGITVLTEQFRALGNIGTEPDRGGPSEASLFVPGLQPVLHVLNQVTWLA